MSRRLLEFVKKTVQVAELLISTGEVFRVFYRIAHCIIIIKDVKKTGIHLSFARYRFCNFFIKSF